MQNTINPIKRGTRIIDPETQYLNLATAWGIDVEELYNPSHAEAEKDLKAWRDLTLDAQAPTVEAIVANMPRDKWLPEIKKAAPKIAVDRLVQDANAPVLHALNGRLRHSYTSPEAVSHVASILDVQDAVNRFTDAANELGDMAYNPMEAAQHNPTAYSEYAHNGMKLLTLDLFATGKYGVAALHADVPELSPLQYRKDGFNHRTNHYTEEEKKVHNIAYGYRTAARDDASLTDLALGKYAPLTLATTLDPTTRAQRARSFEVAYEFEEVG
ncbi:hypothetical protein [Corynebacterium falsenii]|uniref:hypothetical protein n=1 Tax=Corynebacterium falsenii TaxID=108486 RepID=UPI003FD06C35